MPGDATADLGLIPDLLPGNTVTLTHEWSGVPAGGKVTQSVTAIADDLVYERETSFWIVPWWAIATLLALILQTEPRGT